MDSQKMTGNSEPVLPVESPSGISGAVGRAVRHHRVLTDMTLRQLAEKSHISSAMISRIENGQVSPSLSTLEALAAALTVPVVSLFQNTIQTADIHFVKDGAGLPAKRIAPGHVHDFRILGNFASTAIQFQAARVTLERKHDGTHPFYISNGYIFLTITDGTCIYSCGDQVFEMESGDSLTFDAQLRHGVTRILTETVMFTTVSARTT